MPQKKFWTLVALAGLTVLTLVRPDDGWMRVPLRDRFARLRLRWNCFAQFPVFSSLFRGRVCPRRFALASL